MNIKQRSWGRGHEMFLNIKRRYLHGYEFMRLKFKVIGVLGVCGFPLFFFVWHDFYPQPYENFWLRLILAGMCGIFLINNYLPDKITAYAPIYAYITSILVLPFFFTFMLLKNDANLAWQMSSMCAVLYLVLIFDAINTLIIWGTGVAFALLCFIFTSETTIPPDFFIGLPVVLFALIGSILFSHTEELLKYERRMQTVATLGSNIAHEMRTPLLGIKFDAQGIQKILLRVQNNSLQPKDVEGLEAALRRIDHQTVFANTVIDMLLANVRQEEINPKNFQHYSMVEVIDQALQRFPFKPGQRDWIDWDRQKDFQFLGSDILMIHVLFNLLKNALRAIAAQNHGIISIRLEPGTKKNKLIFRDTGTGIAPDVLPHIFDRFFTASENLNGAGIGLSFSRRVVNSFNGTIACISECGKFTEFTVSFSTVPEDDTNV